MRSVRILCLSLVLLLPGAKVFAEGFAMTEWSARGLSLANGMVARADDASAVAYNPAGITQLRGVHLMAGGSLIAPYGSVQTRDNSGTRTTDARRLLWFPPHMHATWQINDAWWLGFGLFSRFGLGNQYSSNWTGRHNIYNIGLQTVSVNPVIAYKVNDWLSLAVGAELMRLDIYLESKIRIPIPGARDNDMNLEGSGWGVGMNAAAHIRFNEHWSAGLTYRSQVTQHVTGKVKFRDQYPPGLLGSLRDADANATVQLPDSAALAVMWKPLPNLSFEVGTVWTRWSTYNALNIYSDKGLRSINQKSWRDGWNFNASVEYRPLDWLALRLGYWHETPVVNEKYADYMLPTYGRDVLTAGVGFKWNNWTLDLAYAHLWIQSVSYNKSAARSSAISPGKSKNTHADIVSVSLGYSF